MNVINVNTNYYIELNECIKAYFTNINNLYILIYNIYIVFINIKK